MNKAITITLMLIPFFNYAQVEKNITFPPTAQAIDCTAAISDKLVPLLPTTVEENTYNTTKEYIAVCVKQLVVAKSLNERSVQSVIEGNLKAIHEKLNDNQNITDLMFKVTKDGDKALTLAYNTRVNSSDMVESINQVLEDNKVEYLLPSWRDVDFSYQFYTGFEYNKVGDLFDDSTLRLGFQAYLRPGNDVEDVRKGCRSSTADCSDWSFNIPHFYGNFQLTGAAESAAGDTNDDEQPGFEALEYELGAFLPIYFGISSVPTMSDYQEFAFGLIVTGGGRKTDHTDNFQDRYYAGLRFSHNEESYFDLLYGKSEPLKGKRVEIRGQLPVSNIGVGRLFLGGAANFEVSRKESNQENPNTSEADSFKVYLIWQTTFDDIWKGLSNTDNS